MLRGRIGGAREMLGSDRGCKPTVRACPIVEVRHEQDRLELSCSHRLWLPGLFSFLCFAIFLVVTLVVFGGEGGQVLATVPQIFGAVAWFAAGLGVLVMGLIA